MNMNCFMRASALLLTASALLLAPAVAQTAAPIAVEAFFKKPAVRAPQLSPSGKKIAMMVPSQSGRAGLAIADIERPEKFVGIAQFDDADIGSFNWVNDGRLVFTAVDFQAALGDQQGSGLYAVNADGSDFRWLIERSGNYKAVSQTGRRPMRSNYRFAGVPLDGSSEVIVQRWVSNGAGQPADAELMRLDTHTMSTRRMYSGTVPFGTSNWLLDRDLQPRVVQAFDGKRTLTTYMRETTGNTWEEIARADIVEDGAKAISPVAVDRDGQLYVTAVNPHSQDATLALYLFDRKHKRIADQPLLSVPGFDFSGNMVFDLRSKQLLAINYLQDAPGVAWFDKGLKEVQHAVDQQLPNTLNVIQCPAANCVDAKHLIVTASSDIQSPIYFLLNRATGKLKLLGATRPWLDSRQMAGTQIFERIKARDGMEIPVYVTKPKGKGPWPTVVMIHGGPYVRGSAWGFHATNQFLASRGYLVVEPEFRGSTGYGEKLARAGWKQWGLAMQDDMTDATRWAVAQGMADPLRIAIAGASYGGYAALMGLLKEPELYKAAINWVGVTDIELMYSIGWSDFLDSNNPSVRYGMPVMIGDPDKDREQLRATSPLKQAHRIKRPVLMAYGVEDYRVPLPHGTKMRDALIASGNKDVEWVQYEGEGHGFMLTKNNVDFWTRVERFLAKHLK